MTCSLIRSCEPQTTATLFLFEEEEHRRRRGGRGALRLRGGLRGRPGLRPGRGGRVRRRRSSPQGADPGRRRGRVRRVPAGHQLLRALRLHGPRHSRVRAGLRSVWNFFFFKATDFVAASSWHCCNHLLLAVIATLSLSSLLLLWQ